MIRTYTTQTLMLCLYEREFGMVFQKPNPFPKSIFDNVAYGPRIHCLAESTGHLSEIVEEALEKQVSGMR